MSSRALGGQPSAWTSSPEKAQVRWRHQDIVDKNTVTFMQQVNSNDTERCNLLCEKLHFGKLCSFTCWMGKRSGVTFRRAVCLQCTQNGTKAAKVGLKTQKLVQNCERQKDQGYLSVKIELLLVSWLITITYFMQNSVLFQLLFHLWMVSSCPGSLSALF